MALKNCATWTALAMRAANGKHALVLAAVEDWQWSIWGFQLTTNCFIASIDEREFSAELTPMSVEQ